ncbi:hypothetical protein AB0912_22150 [Streptomyces sp. NPDC007084]|uniref:hypothetical protein n=1 Tax=Streptomyces sp. NPDC007084 TaxID=3154313 RepID=UPI0034538758
MSSSPPPLGAPVPDPRALLTRLGQRVLEREGIPMFLTLQSAAPPTAPAEAAPPHPEGAELSGLLGHYRDALAPEAPDTDEPALIEVLQVMGAAHFFPRDDEEGSPA